MIGKIIITILLAMMVAPTACETLYCDSCENCTALIQSANPGDTVRLTVNISGNSEDCICFNGTDGITFDGGGYTINDSDRGVYLSSYSNGNTVRNVTLTNFWYGVHLVTASDNVVENITCKTSTISGRGIYVYGSDHNLFRNVDVSNIYQGALQLSGSDYNVIDSSNISDNNYVGVYITNSDHNVLNNSYIIQNAEDGIWVVGSSFNNLIYNNYFDNPSNVDVTSGYSNIWNVTATPGKNIINESLIGGNYWHGYTGIDDNEDGFIDAPYVVVSNNTDYLPLQEVGTPQMYIRNDGYDIQPGEMWEYLITCRNSSGRDVDCDCYNLTWEVENESVGVISNLTIDGANFTALAVGTTNVSVHGFYNLTDTITQNVTGRECECGDVDCDGGVTMLDCLEVYRRVINPAYPLTSEWAADVDNDSDITMLDCLGIYNRIINPSYPLHCAVP